MDQGFRRPVRRHSRELNVVPILDMMTTLIIFLLQITSFLEYTKVTLPPSSVSTITNPLAPPPITPKLMVMYRPEKKSYRLQLLWTGDKPGEDHASFPSSFDEAAAGPPAENLDRTAQNILLGAQVLVRKFHHDFPDERTIQVGVSSDVPYQHLIAVMDGVQAAFGNIDPAKFSVKPEDLANIVLISYAEVDAEVARSGGDL